MSTVPYVANIKRRVGGGGGGEREKGGRTFGGQVPVSPNSGN